MLLSEMKNILEHVRNISRQTKEQQHQKERFQQGEIIQWTDCAENYYIMYPDEVKQTHWNAKQGQFYNNLHCSDLLLEASRWKVQLWACTMILEATKHYPCEVNI